MVLYLLGTYFPVLPPNGPSCPCTWDLTTAGALSIPNSPYLSCHSGAHPLQYLLHLPSFQIYCNSKVGCYFPSSFGLSQSSPPNYLCCAATALSLLPTLAPLYSIYNRHHKIHIYRNKMFMVAENIQIDILV